MGWPRGFQPWKHGWDFINEAPSTIHPAVFVLLELAGYVSNKCNKGEFFKQKLKTFFFAKKEKRSQNV